MNLKIFLAFPMLLGNVVISVLANPKWVWIPDEFDVDRVHRNASINGLSRQNPSDPQTQIIYHYHEHHNSGGGGGGGGGGRASEDFMFAPTNKAKGQTEFERWLDCKRSSCQAYIHENHKVCNAEYPGYQYYDYSETSECPSGKRKRYVCCKPKPGCAFTKCYRDSWKGKDACHDYLGSSYKFTGSYTTATCEWRVKGNDDFKATCCKEKTQDFKALWIG